MGGGLSSRMHEVVWPLELELSKDVGCIAEDRLKGRLGRHGSTQINTRPKSRLKPVPREWEWVLRSVLDDLLCVDKVDD